MLEAAHADLVSPSAWSAAPKIFSYPQDRRPITPSIPSPWGRKADVTSAPLNERSWPFASFAEASV